jgi:hypothetical protein
MTNNLPAKRTSRGIQRSHVRRYSTGKVAVVNPEVRKKPSLPPPRTSFRPTDRSLIRPTEKKLSVWDYDKPKIQFKQKKRFIENKEDFWKAIQQLPDFEEILGWINNNLEDAKYELYDNFRQELEKELKENPTQGLKKAEEEALKNTLEAFDEDRFWDNWAGKDRFIITKWGDWSKDKNLDDIIDDYDQYDYHHDPFEGEIFKTDTGDPSPDWDENKWYTISIDSRLGSEELDEAEIDPRFPDEAKDKEIFQRLKKASIPFLHIDNGYHTPKLFIPRKYQEKVKKLLEQ